MIPGDTDPRPPAAPAPEPEVADDPVTPQVRLWWLFVSLAALLLWRSRELFTKVIFEEGDAAANSILVEQAKQFSQLVGNYSRIGFHHPGPGFLYVQGWGEWLFHDVLGLVPTPWNGQALAVILLNAFLIATAATIVCRWLGPFPWLAWVLAAVAGAALLFLGTHWDLATNIWPPFEYFAPYLLLLASAASVAAGRVRDLWALVLAAGLLWHGHAEFLFLATVMSGTALWMLWRRHRGGVRELAAANRWPLIGAGALLVVVLLPIAINTVANWPGEFGKYLSYGAGHGVNMPWKAAYYVLKLWDDNLFIAVPLIVGLFGGVAYAARRTQHVYLRTGLFFAGLAIGSFLLYAIVGIDSLSEYYIGYFTRAVPLFLILLVAAAVARYAGNIGRLLAVGRLFSVAVAVAGLIVGLTSPTLVNRRLEVPDVPAALDAIQGRLAPGQPVVVTVEPIASWAEAVPLALSGHRRGLRVCFTNQSLQLEASPAYLCTGKERETGLKVTVARTGTEPAGQTELAPLNQSVVWVTR